MKRPFNIFPSIGYKNSQFQIISSIDNLKIELSYQGKLEKTIFAGSKYPTLITRLDKSGTYNAKCIFRNESFEKVIIVKDAFRLGSSEFKKAFVFDNSNYSFFLLNDRLLLYDEEKKLLLTENHYSPSEILKIDNSNYLFITRIGNATDGIINLGIYNTDSFSIISELLNDYQEIWVSTETNKVWLFKKSTKSIHCFEIINHKGNGFSELKKYEDAINFTYDSDQGRLYIEYSERFIITDINNLHNSVELEKTEINAIDKWGNNLIIEGDIISCTNVLNGYSFKTTTAENIKLAGDSYIYIGEDLKSKISNTDFSKLSNEIKDKIICSIPDNNTYFYHSIPKNERIKETITKHRIYPTQNGLFLIKEEEKREFDGVTLRKYQSEWRATPHSFLQQNSTLSLLELRKTHIIIDKANAFRVNDYRYLCLTISSDSKKQIFIGNTELSLDNESTVFFLSARQNFYCLIKNQDFYSLYSIPNFKTVILNQIEIHNFENIDEHETIWYSTKDKSIPNAKELSAFDLKDCFHVQHNKKGEQHTLFKDASNFKFKRGYALSSNQIIFNPRTFEIKDSYVGLIEAHSQNLEKVVSHRINNIYLSVYNSLSKKYEASKIPLEEHKYKESYLSPNGQFLVLQDETDKYLWYDIEKNETLKFLSGNFLAFRNDGNLIIEEDRNRAVKIIDPLTFQDITPPNYHHYRFLSPDGKLYSQLSFIVRYINKLSGKELTTIEVEKLQQELDEPNSLIQEKEREQEQLKVDMNRQNIFTANKEIFEKLNVDDPTKINSRTIIKVEKYTKIGIVGTDLTTEVVLPADTQFYNYAAFSYDNRYIGIVGKPVWSSVNKSLIMLCSINFEESQNKLELNDTYISRYPRYASWVCGFSKTGYFSTYDSNPDTFILYVDDNFFVEKTSDIELKQNIYNFKSNIYHSYNKWNEIKDKNFLCFSPSGEFLALSEQGYEPLTLGGYGHQESNVVHIAKTESGKILDSFTGHGAKIKDNKTKKVTFVAFSEDEKRIMTLSSDGVVIIRNIKISEDREEE